MRAPRCARTVFRAHVQEIDARIAGWARRQRGEYLIGAFGIPNTIVLPVY